jgi:hypothetical protein
MSLVLNPLHFPSLTQEIFDLRQVDDILWSGTTGNPYPSFTRCPYWPRESERNRRIFILWICLDLLFNSLLASFQCTPSSQRASVPQTWWHLIQKNTQLRSSFDDFNTWQNQRDLAQFSEFFLYALQAQPGNGIIPCLELSDRKWIGSPSLGRRVASKVPSQRVHFFEKSGKTRFFALTARW